MQRFLNVSFAAVSVLIPVFAGALTLQVDDVKANPEALARNAIVAVHITACHSPEKTIIAATAEGFVDGKRQTIPLKVINLSAGGAFAVSREWQQEGTWAVKVVATNPEYQGYATGIIVPISKSGARSTAAKVFYHAPSADEVNSVLKQTASE
jgi:hypothetical protein